MKTERLRELLPDAPPWFWECSLCSEDAKYCHPVVLGWLETKQSKNLDGTLWDWVRPFFAHYHHEINHKQFHPYRSTATPASRAKQRASARRWRGLDSFEPRAQPPEANELEQLVAEEPSWNLHGNSEDGREDAVAGSDHEVEEHQARDAVSGEANGDQAVNSSRTADSWRDEIPKL